MNRWIVASFLTVATSAWAGECVLKIKREACPGKEAAAFKPYNGKVETEEKKTAADAGACKTEAQKAAKIVRKGTLSKKTVVAILDGKEAGTETDSVECK